jgi:hypothetical protein
MKAFALALAIAIIPTALGAQNVMVWGSGISSCGSWTKDSNNSPVHHQREGWLLGFVSGYNWYAEDRIEDIKIIEDGNALVAWVDNYCFARPLDPLVMAAKNLIEDLRRRNGLRPN